MAQPTTPYDVGDLSGADGMYGLEKNMTQKQMRQAIQAVSYTHLDVYKRQGLNVSLASHATESCRIGQ